MRKKERQLEGAAAHVTDVTTSDDATTGHAPDASGAGDPAALESELLKSRAREEELLRALAELTNATRRRKQEMDAGVLYAEESIVRGLLPVLDDFERALAAWDRAPDDPMRAGFALIHERLRGTLAQQGLEEIRPLNGQFDPELHDALMQRPTADAPPDRVLEVVKPGYRFRGRVLRHAQVIVSGPPEKEQA